MTAKSEPQPILEYEYGSFHKCDRCQSGLTVQILADENGDYFSCLVCGMMAYPEQFNARFVSK